MAWTAMLERNRCCSLAHTDVPIAAEACDWWREDATALGRKLLMPGMFVGTGWPRLREERVKGGAPWRTDHLDQGPQRLA